MFSPQKIVERYYYSAAAGQVRSKFTHYEIGKAVNEEKLLRLKKGATTRAEVVEAFGPPLAERLNIRGQLVLSWLYARVGSPRSGDMQVLAVLLDNDGKVEDYRIQERSR